VGYGVIVVAIAIVGGFGDGYRVSGTTRKHMIAAKEFHMEPPDHQLHQTVPHSLSGALSQPR